VAIDLKQLLIQRGMSNLVVLLFTKEFIDSKRGRVDGGEKQETQKIKLSLKMETLRNI
jgi:hypothetical protein